MIKQIVVMPTLKRLEMLALALERLARTNESDLDVRIFADTDANLEELDYVRDNYYPDAMIFHAGPHVDVPSGMWNILNALKQGYETAADLIYIVEEDVLVKPDFFKWHQSAQEPGILATCGRRMQGALASYSQYTNPGSCFSLDKLRLVVKHITKDLFNNRRAYMDGVFGRMDEVSDLDDGLIRRIARFYGLPVKYPDIPKCSHIGFTAYNRYFGWTNNEGDIKYRIEKLRMMLPTVDMKSRYTHDFEPSI
jgi:hypothetical protein